AGVVGVTFGADGCLASVCQDGTVRVWGLATGRELFTLPGQTAGPGSLAFSPDGRQLASAGAAKVAVCDAATGQELVSFPRHGKAVTAVTFSPDGRLVASAGLDETGGGWETATGDELSQLRSGQEFVAHLAFTDKDKRLNVAFGNGTLTFFSLESQQETVALQHSEEQTVPNAWSRDGRLLTNLGPPDCLRVMESASGRELFALRGHAAPVTSLAFSADDRRIATGSRDGTVRVWTTAFEEEVVALPGHI